MSRYMMATTAHHTLGDISNDTPALAIISSETATDYIGQWAAGFGFIGVRFPKTTTRELTDDEKRHYQGKYRDVAGAIHPIRIEDAR